MAIRVVLQHDTHYHYNHPVSLSPHIFRLRPAPHTRTPIEAYTMSISPEKHFLNWQQDPFGNFQARVVFPEPTNHLSIKVELITKLEIINPFDFFLDEKAEKYPFTYEPSLRKELTPYLEIEESGPKLSTLIQEVDRQSQNTIDFLVHVNQLVNQQLHYEIRMSPGVQSCEETLMSKRGSCRDYSWLMVQLFRHLGLAARFVSGYSIQLTADEKSLDGPSGVEKDVTDLHAWVEVYVPGAGWIGLDATSGLLATEGHIPLACTPHYKSAAPVVGSIISPEPFDARIEFHNTVHRLQEDPRVSRPYTDVQWQAIYQLGEQVDADLQQQDVRLTMGGEPTFVSIDDMESAEWNTAADGTHKRQLAWDLAERLRETFGSGGFVHHGQGKWYPGEPIPRWAYTIFWRKDGYAIWKNPALLANPNHHNTFSLSDAYQFAKSLADRLRFPESVIHPAYEDIFYMLWEESQVPINVDPLKATLDDPVERRNLAKMLDEGLGNPKGYILPIEWNFHSQSWRTSIWPVRRSHIVLIPGNSPIGLRLPLKTLPDSVDQHESIFRERSMFAELDNLPHPNNYREIASSLAEADTFSSEKVVRTAMCLEIRDGQLYIFFPPLSYAEHYLELMTHIEAVATQLQIPVLIEGYKPPRDYRMEQLSITPDPGVIEVNIHPATSWSEIVDRTLSLYDQARSSRLSTDKFMIDGRHVGTGGGNHITLGSSKPIDSPFLRRPDLLQSMITYWQHHPGLSYLFSSAFVGPTSQAPRVDEAREDRLYEMEIAFSQIPMQDESIPPWLVDRIFRNLLTDMTGNTHRAEFCIDKLYSPDSSSGRLGILELRGFDMPPHKYMSLVQMLLIRALISWFWREPYRHDLVRWGTELHDKFLLSHFCRRDLEEVVADLHRAGYPFELSWLDPYVEFRFPRYGTVHIRDIEMELRMAIEPWHVLGEEMSQTGTARFVDSSLERVEVTLRGLTDKRYILLCNGTRIPLHFTGVHGEYVAGIRYRAWQPPSALHPTIGIDSPLVFDLIDTWNKRSIGGCTYHVSHPGGRAYDTFPVNSYEAESRRINRFRDIGYTPGPIQVNPVQARTTTVVAHHNQSLIVNDIPKAVILPEFPYTLDLRKVHK